MPLENARESGCRGTVGLIFGMMRVDTLAHRIGFKKSCGAQIYDGRDFMGFFSP